MNITLNMKIQDQDIQLKVNLTNAVGRIYRQHFERDLLRDMAEIYKKLHRSPFENISLEGIDVNGKSEQEIYEQLVSKIDLPSVLAYKTEANLSFEEEERGSQIIWAFVKNADKNLPNYSDWVDGFDFILPVGDIVSALFEAWNHSAQPTIELKN